MFPKHPHNPTSLRHAGTARSVAVGLALLGSGAMEEALAQSGCPGGSGGPIAITNFAAKDTLAHDLALIRGTLPAGIPQVTIAAGGASGNWPVGEATFKAMVRLKPGKNQVVVSAAGAQSACMELAYIPDASGNQVQLVLALPIDQKPDEAVFRTYPGEPAGIESARKRLSTLALLYQSVLGDLTDKAGMGRRVPLFKRDPLGDPEVLVVYGDHTKEDTSKSPFLKFDPILAKLKPFSGPRIRFLIFHTIKNGSFTTGSNGNTFIGAENSLVVLPQNLEELLVRFNDRRTFAQVGVPGHEGDQTQLFSGLKTTFGFWFQAFGTGALSIPTVSQKDFPQDPFGSGNSNQNTLFQSKDANGELIRTEVALSASSVAVIDTNTWLVGKPKALAALPTALVPANLTQGVDYNYYEGPFDLGTDFSAYGSILSGVASSFTVSARRVQKNYAFVFDSYLKVEIAGYYRFEIASDGASSVKIGERALISKSGTAATGGGNILLQSGYHRLKVIYVAAENGSGTIMLNWALEGMALAPVPLSALLHNGSSVPVLRNPEAEPMVRIVPGEFRMDLASAGHVTLSSVSLQGRSLGTLFSGVLPAGSHRFELPAKARNAVIQVKVQGKAAQRRTTLITR